MSAIATAIIGSAAIGVWASGKIADSQEKAANKAVKSQEKITDQTLQLQKELADTQRADFAPWRDVGQQALQQLQAGVNDGSFEVGKVDVTQDPGYQFRLDQGIEARDKSAAARGRLLSGAQEKGITNYAQGLASQEYANAYARQANEKANKFNMLQSLSAGGQASAAGQAQSSQNLAAASSNALSSLGVAQQNSAYNAGNARAGAYGDMAQGVNQAAQNWITYQNTKPPVAGAV